jgi:hypothetical protein
VAFLQILDLVVEGAVVVAIESAHAALEGRPRLEDMSYHMALARAGHGRYLNFAGDRGWRCHLPPVKPQLPAERTAGPTGRPASEAGLAPLWGRGRGYDRIGRSPAILLRSPRDSLMADRSRPVPGWRGGTASHFAHTAAVRATGQRMPASRAVSETSIRTPSRIASARVCRGLGRPTPLPPPGRTRGRRPAAATR